LKYSGKLNNSTSGQFTNIDCEFEITNENLTNLISADLNDFYCPSGSQFWCLKTDIPITDITWVNTER
jgi:hypothetical protein